MNFNITLKEEFELRVFKESYQRIYKCLSMINDEQLWESPSSNIPAIGNLILHLCGNARQWLLSGLGGVADNRERDEEFVLHKNIRKSDLIFLLENLKTNISPLLNSLSEDQLKKRYIIQGFQVSGFSAVIHVLEHFSYHTGQITTITKWLTNRETGYYSGLNLNQHNED